MASAPPSRYAARTEILPGGLMTTAYRTVPLRFETLPPDTMRQRAHDFRSLLDRRRTVRDFSDRPVPREVIEACVMSAATAPSGANQQPWTFVCIANSELKKQIRVAAEEEERTFYAGRASAEWLEALAPLGTDAEIRKLPDAQLATIATNKTYDLITETTSAMLPSTDYFFRIFFQGASRWNLGNWNNQEIADLAAKARFEPDKATYDMLAKKMIALAATELPVIPLWQANQEAVMAKSIGGYTYWYHRQIDFRELVRE